MKNLRARVFISCGQRKSTDEVRITRCTAEKLETLGFDPYIAVEEQCLKGVRENVFRRLSESEYIIFIDFKRERLYELKDDGFVDIERHRGSLFSNQELAVATFLDIEPLLFQEGGVKEEDGILRFLQSNCIPFTDRDQLPSLAIKKIEERKWNPNWRNELLLERDDKDLEDNVYATGVYRPGSACFYHIKVRNLHQQKIAYGCIAFLKRVRDLSTGEDKPFELVEFKWKGLTTREAAIPPKAYRHLDAFRIYYDLTDVVYLGINPFLTDFSAYQPIYTLRGPGKFELVFVVFSENFSPARTSFELHVEKRLDDIRFFAMDP